MVDIIPGIGISGETLVEIEQKVRLVAPYVEWIQIDFADGTLVPATTCLEIEKFKSLISETGKSFEAHLMVAQPEKYVKRLADAGFKRVIAHVEAEDPRLFLTEAAFDSVEVMLAIDGPSEFEQIEPYLDEVDGVLVMTVEAGASGQPFLEETLEKVRTLHKNLPDLPIEVDGGMTPQTIRLAKDAGATRIVATSFIFRDLPNIGEAIQELQNA